MLHPSGRGCCCCTRIAKILAVSYAYGNQSPIVLQMVMLRQCTRVECAILAGAGCKCSGAGACGISVSIVKFLMHTYRCWRACAGLVFESRPESLRKNKLLLARSTCRYWYAAPRPLEEHGNRCAPNLRHMTKQFCLLV